MQKKSFSEQQGQRIIQTAKQPLQQRQQENEQKQRVQILKDLYKSLQLLKEVEQNISKQSKLAFERVIRLVYFINPILDFEALLDQYNFLFDQILFELEELLILIVREPPLRDIFIDYLKRVEREKLKLKLFKLFINDNDQASLPGESFIQSEVLQQSGISLKCKQFKDQKALKPGFTMLKENQIVSKSNLKGDVYEFELYYLDNPTHKVYFPFKKFEPKEYIIHSLNENQKNFIELHVLKQSKKLILRIEKIDMKKENYGVLGPFIMKMSKKPRIREIEGEFTVFENKNHQQYLAYTMEYAQYNLEDFLNKVNFQLNEQEILSIFVDIFSALKEIHSIGIAVRYLTARNFVFSEKNQIWKLDLLNFSSTLNTNQSQNLSVVGNLDHFNDFSYSLFLMDQPYAKINYFQQDHYSLAIIIFKLKYQIRSPSREQIEDFKRIPFNEKKDSLLIKIIKILLKKDLTQKDSDEILKLVNCPSSKIGKLIYFKGYEKQSSIQDKSNKDYLTQLSLARIFMTILNKQQSVEYFLSAKKLTSDLLKQAEILEELAYLYQEFQENSNATLYYQQSIQLYKQINNTHSSVRIPMLLNNMGILYQQDGLFQQAVDCFQLILQQKIKGQKIEGVVYKENLANCYKDLKLFDKADQLYKEIIEIKKVYYGQDDVEVGLSCNNLGLLKLEIGDVQKGLEYFQRSFEIYKVWFGVFNLKLVDVLESLGKCYEKNDQFMDAFPQYEMIYQIYLRNQVNRKGIKFLDNLEKLVVCAFKSKEYDLVVNRCEQLLVYLNESEKITEKQNQVYEMVAVSQFFKQKYQEAEINLLKYFENLNKFKFLFKNENYKSYKYLSLIQIKLQKWKEAENSIRKSIEIVQKNKIIKIDKYLDILAQTYTQQNKFMEAIENYKKIYELQIQNKEKTYIILENLEKLILVAEQGKLQNNLIEFSEIFLNLIQQSKIKNFDSNKILKVQLILDKNKQKQQSKFVNKYELRKKN